MSTTIEISANAVFIVVSYCISVLGAFTTFQFVHETKFVKAGWKRILLLVCASISMGFCAIWAMHFLGTLCFSFTKVEQKAQDGAPAVVTKTPLPIEYDIGITLISAVVAVILCFIGFMVSSIQQFHPCFRKRLCCPFFTHHDEDLDMIDEGHIELDEIENGSMKKLASVEDITASATTPRAETSPFSKRRRLKLKLPSRAEWRSFVFGSSQKPHLIQLIISSFFNAAGVCTMHYLGMIATQIHETKMVWNGWLVALACLIAYAASFAAFWISFNLKNHMFKVISSFVAACAVAGMHYTGMVSCTYEYSTEPHHIKLTSNSHVSNTDLAMGTTIVTSVACFFLVVLLTAARNILNKTINQLKQEKKTVDKFSGQLQQTVVQMNTLLNQVAFEEHQIRKVMDCLSDPVCVVDEYGNLMKANKKFKTVTSITAESKHSIVDFFPEVEGSMVAFYEARMNRQTQSPSIELQMTLKTMFYEQPVQVAIHQEHHHSKRLSTPAADRSFYILVIQSESIASLQSQRGSSYFAHDQSSFDEDIADTEFYTKFKAFCTEEHCCEGLLFLERVKQYKTCENTMERIEIQKSIATEFLEIGSPNQLNLSKKVLHDALEKIRTAYGQIDLFDELCKQVKELLQHSYTRFKCPTP